MRIYYPVAKTDSKSIVDSDLWVSDGAETLEKAIHQFDVWEMGYGYHIISAYVDVYEDNKKIGCYPVKRVWADDGFHTHKEANS